jgi:hypothetical protein
LTHQDVVSGSTENHIGIGCASVEIVVSATRKGCHVSASNKGISKFFRFFDERKLAPYSLMVS